jgi:hypothetical protein
MSLKLACPRCHHVQFFDDALAGQPVACSKCAQAFRVPRSAEPEAETPTSAVAPWPWPEQMQARELPTTFAPAEPPALQVVPIPEKDAAPARRRFADDEDPYDVGPATTTATAEPVRRRPRPAGRTPIRQEESSRSPWGAGVALIVLVMVLFVGAAIWFLARDHTQPQKRPPFAQQQPPQFQQPMQPMPPPFQKGKMRPFPGMAGQRQWLMLKPGMMVPIAPQPNEQFIQVKLENGVLRHPGVIDAADPGHPLNPAHHRKVYLIDLVKDRNYTIEMNMDPPRKEMKQFQQFVDLDPFLIVEDSQGKLLDFKDDIVEGFNLDSRIQIRVPATGTYRIECTSFAPNETGKFVLNIRDEDKGRPVAALKLPARDIPMPAEIKQALEPEKTTKRNLNIATIINSEEPLVGDLCWASDHAAFFVIDQKGTLRRITWPENVEERRVDLAMQPSALAMARSGLLVSFPQWQEVWVIDPATLQVKNRISAPGLERVAAAPGSDIAVAATRQKANPLPKHVLMILDVAKGIAVRQYENYSPKHAAMTNDGKLIFAEGGVNQLSRYRVEGDEIVLEEESAHLAAQGQGVFISPDGKHVCLPSPGGNNGADAAGQQLKEFTTLIFKSDNLRKAAFSINTGESPRAVGFDPKSGNVFAHNNDKQFMVFRESGIKSREVNLPGADQFSGQPRQFLSHPEGFHVLVRTEHTVYSVELPKDEEK